MTRISEEAAPARHDATATRPSYGRIGRLRYLIWLCAIYLVIQLMSVVWPLWIASLLGGLGCYAIATVRRVRDLGLSSWFALLLGLPLVSLVLLVLPGTRSSNRHGEAPGPASRKEWALALVLLITTLALLVVTWIVVIGPAWAHYGAATAT